MRNGCKWRRLPKEYGNWHAIYKRFNLWVKDEITERLFRELHTNGIVETALPDSVPVHPDACGTLKNGWTVDRPLQGRPDLQYPHDGRTRAELSALSSVADSAMTHRRAGF